MQNCPICNEIELATLQLNMNLPFGERLQIIDIFSNDPRLTYLEKFYKTEDKFKWILPVLVLDRKKLMKRFNNLCIGFSRALFIGNIRSLDHYKTVLESYLSPNTLG